MEHKNTDDLQRELMSQPNLEAYIHENQSFFMEKPLADLLTALFDRHSVSKATLARQAGMSEVYLHQIFSGRRKPSRDRLICICAGLSATLDETQELLRQAAYAQLYPKVKRDAIIMHGICHDTPLNEINDKLFAEKIKTLY